MATRLRMKCKKLVAGLTIWLLILQMTAPALVLAEELPESAPPTEIESSPTPSPTPSSEPTSELITGDIGAEATAIAEVDTTAINSAVEVTVMTIADPTLGEVTPFVLYEPDPSALPSLPSTPSGELDLTVENQATVAATAVASADSGGVTQINETHGVAAMQTGDTVALANTIALVNTTLVDSTLQVGVVNILTPWDGDIILDPLSEAALGTEIFAPGSLNLTIDNSGNVVVEAVATATAGENQQTAAGDAEMVTGDTMALSSATSVVGLTAVNTELVEILAQNLWLWSGLIYNWDHPGSVQTPGEVLGVTGSAGRGGCGSGCGNLDVEVVNAADVNVSAEATAETGDNVQVSSGSAEMRTGSAMAGATATAVVNSTLINSRLTILHLLLFAPWSGDLIMAYPDIAVTVAAPSEVIEGEDIPFVVTIGNVGHKSARAVDYHYDITKSGEVLGGSGENLADLAPGAEVVRTINFPTGGRGGQTLTLAASAMGNSAEVTRSNNAAAANTLVKILERTTQADSRGDGDDGNSTEVPKLRLDSQNNAGLGVYPGDGVTYDLEAYNDGPITAHNVYLIQEFFDIEGNKLSEMKAKVGEIGVTKKRHIRFVMTPGVELPSGSYYTVSYLTGESDQGAGTESNRPENGIELLLRKMVGAVIPRVEAQDYLDIGGEEVLGSQTQLPRCESCVSWPWYAAIALGSLIYLATGIRRRDWRGVLKWGLALPLAAYAGLLWTNPNCVVSNVLLQGSWWCQWFLLAANGIYLSEGWVLGKWQQKTLYQKV